MKYRMIFIPSVGDIQKSCFLMRIQYMDQNIFSGTIKYEAIPSTGQRPHQKSLCTCGKPVMTKTT